MMYFKKIAGPMKITCGTGGADANFPLPARSGGHLCKVAQFQVKVLSYSGTTPKVGFTINHGPEAGVLMQYNTTASVAIPASNLYTFDASPGTILGEYIQGVLVAGGAATGDSVLVEVYEMRKPF